MPARYQPEHFIDEPIEVGFDAEPLLKKKPSAPDRFLWRGESYERIETLQEWFDYGRRGRMSKNMSPAHLHRARQQGSWGVGRTFFRLRVEGGRIFDLYYDRAPHDASDRSGSWMLWREIQEATG